MVTVTISVSPALPWFLAVVIRRPQAVAALVLAFGNGFALPCVQTGGGHVRFAVFRGDLMVQITVEDRSFYRRFSPAKLPAVKLLYIAPDRFLVYFLYNSVNYRKNVLRLLAFLAQFPAVADYFVDGTALGYITLTDFNHKTSFRE
jgi:hypothetical protein